MTLLETVNERTNGIEQIERPTKSCESRSVWLKAHKNRGSRSIKEEEEEEEDERKRDLKSVARVFAGLL
jgi:hypothetical protein